MLIFLNGACERLKKEEKSFVNIILSLNTLFAKLGTLPTDLIS
jgi:hypothetical protein